MNSVFYGGGGREYFFSLMGKEAQRMKRSAWEMCQVVVNHSPKGLCCSKCVVNQETCMWSTGSLTVVVLAFPLEIFMCSS